MADNKQYRYLNALLVKNECAENDFSAFLSSDSMVTNSRSNGTSELPLWVENCLSSTTAPGQEQSFVCD